jgi:hypothetical protein
MLLASGLASYFLSFVSVSEKQHESLPLSWRSSRSWLLRWKEKEMMQVHELPAFFSG